MLRHALLIAALAACSHTTSENDVVEFLKARPAESRAEVVRKADGRVERMKFDDRGRVIDFGFPESEIDEIVGEGVAFRTSGCPGKFRDDVSACDRPYGDSPPSNIASYPFQPNKPDLRKIRRQLKT